MQLRDQSARAEARACAIGQHRRDVLPIEGPRIPRTAPRTLLLIAVPSHPTRTRQCAHRTGDADEQVPQRTPPTSAPEQRSPAAIICTGTGLAPPTSAPGLGAPLAHLHRDRANCSGDETALSQRVHSTRTGWQCSTFRRRTGTCKPRASLLPQPPVAQALHRQGG